MRPLLLGSVLLLAVLLVALLARAPFGEAQFAQFVQQKLVSKILNKGEPLSPLGCSDICQRQFAKQAKDVPAHPRREFICSLQRYCKIVDCKTCLSQHPLSGCQFHEHLCLDQCRLHRLMARDAILLDKNGPNKEFASMAARAQGKQGVNKKKSFVPKVAKHAKVAPSFKSSSSKGPASLLGYQRYFSLPYCAELSEGYGPIPRNVMASPAKVAAEIRARREAEAEGGAKAGAEGGSKAQAEGGAKAQAESSDGGGNQEQEGKELADFSLSALQPLVDWEEEEEEKDFSDEDQQELADWEEEDSDLLLDAQEFFDEDVDEEEEILQL